MTFEDKVAGAKQLVLEVLKEAGRPAVMCSFGKDSMVALHLVRSVPGGKALPVIFHREPFLPRKYRFARKVTALWDLTVYDFPPQGTAVQRRGDDVEVVNYYPAGARPCALPTGLTKPAKGEPTLCALYDFYARPCGTFAYPWDVVFHGHKSSDVDPIYGAVPLNADFARNIDSVSAAFPLRHFTDADVWRYTEQLELPIHLERYEKTSKGWRERADKTQNPDYFPACTACMVPAGGSVPCPRLGGREVSNIADQLRWAKREAPAYLQTAKT